MTQLVTREQWGARPREQGTTDIIDHPSTTIHWEGEGSTFPWLHSTCDDKMRSIQAYHMDTRNWSDIAYNYVACPHDFLFEGRGYDRRSAANGNDEFNNLSFAICAMWGSNSGSTLPKELLRALLFGIDYLQEHGGATNVVKGHRDWHSTDCPGDQLYAWVQAGCPSPDPIITNKDFDVATIIDLRAAIKAEFKLATLDGGVFYEVVQAFSGWNAENLRQRIDDIGNFAANATDLAVKDDFQALQDQVTATERQIDNLVSAVNTLAAKLPAQS